MGKEYGEFAIEFGSKIHEVNASVYGTVLINTVVLIDEVSNELENGARFEVRLRAEKEGSYLSDLVLQAGAVIGVTSPLLTRENLYFAKEFASRVIRTVGKCLDLAKKLNGETPKQIQIDGKNAVIVYGDNNTVTVNHSVKKIVLENPRAQEAIFNSFSALEDEPAIEHFKILDSAKRPVFATDASEFPKLTKKIKSSEAKRRRRKVKAVLSVSRQSFEREKKSDFFYAGNPISALIDDHSFWDSVDRGEKFAKGDKLVTDLEILEELNEAVQVFERKGYRILRVREHRPRDVQPYLTNDFDKHLNATRPPRTKPSRKAKTKRSKDPTKS
jgi:hypothetical protein